MTTEVDMCPTCKSEAYPVRFMVNAPDGGEMPCVDSWHAETEMSLSQQRAVPYIDRDKVFYLSGPMAGYENLNFGAFEEAARALRAADIMIVSPNELKMPNEPDPAMEGLDYLAYDFEVMARECQGIILLKGWPTSRGARAELEIALTLKWPVYYYHDFMLTDMNANGVS